jgi:hypothetical protein
MTDVPGFCLLGATKWKLVIILHTVLVSPLSARIFVPCEVKHEMTTLPPIKRALYNSLIMINDCRVWFLTFWVDMRNGRESYF